MKNKEFPSFGTNGRLNHPDDLKKHFSDKTYLDFAKGSKSPMVYCFISIDGKDFKGSFAVEIIQNTHHHDTFEVTTPDDNFDSFEGYVMENSKNLSGKNITIDFWRYGSSKQSFRGIIGKVTNKKNEGGGYGNLIITGFAPSIFLESGKDCQSFEDKTLAQIISEICSPYPQEAKVKSETLNTKYNIPYTVQYKETDYQFIKRLSVLYGEYFYYNGEDLVFGNKVQPIVKLNEGVDLIDVEFELNIKPQDFGYISYDAVSGEQMTKDSSQSQSQYKENPFQAILINSSKKIFRKKPQMHFNHTGISGRNVSELQEAVRKERENRENLILVKGKSKDPELKIGGRAKISDINSKAMETYRIIEIKHYYNGDTYYNEFIGIPDLLNPPYQDNDAVPFGEIQTGRVIDNNDPLGAGRIRVQFPWQMAKNQKTPWIKTLTDYAGAGRGNYKIPEVGDEVLVGFESNNAEKPFVLGATYNGNEASGYYTAGNDIKAVKTRSGIEQIFNDEERSWKQSTPDGNYILQDGQKNTVINVPNDFTINVGGNFNINVGKNVSFLVGLRAIYNIGVQMIMNTPILKYFVTDNYHLQSPKTLINGEGEIKIEAKETNVAGFKKLFMHSDEKATMNSKGDVLLSGKSGVHNNNTPIVYDPTKLEVDAKAIVHFRPLDSWDGSGFGFDFMRIGDTLLTGDKATNIYEKIVGKNSTSFPDSTKFDLLENDYSQHIITTKQKKDASGTLMTDASGKPILQEYYVPWLSLFPKKKGTPLVATGFSNTEADLMLYVNVDEEPDKLELLFDDTLFDINKKELTPKTVTTTTPHKVQIKIKCLKEFDTDKEIVVLAIKNKADGTKDEFLAGKLKVSANKKRYKTKIAIVEVTTKNISTGKNTGNSSGRENELRKHLRQALIEPEFTSSRLSINLSSDTTGSVPNAMTNFNTAHARGGKIWDAETITIQNDLNTVLYAKYDALGIDYRNHYKVYLINEPASPSFNPSEDAFGWASGIPSAIRSAIVYKAGLSDSTIAHETLHTMGLNHSFEDAGKYTFEYQKTDNIMDYSDVSPTAPMPVIQLWKWQYAFIYPNVDAE